MFRGGQLRWGGAIALAVWTALAAISPGCSTPTLPLPPPAALTATAPDASGVVTVEGDVLEGSYVFCFNHDVERGVIVRADDTGHFVLRIEAMSGHYLDVWQELGTDASEKVALPVP